MDVTLGQGNMPTPKILGTVSILVLMDVTLGHPPKHSEKIQKYMSQSLF